jgi:hypothetical protein
MRIRIRIILGGRIRICIKLKRRIPVRIRTKVLKLGAVEAHNGVMMAHNGAMMAHNGAIVAPPRSRGGTQWGRGG